jgi:hypothetical protein
MQLTAYHQKVLAQLDTRGGSTTSQVAGLVEPMFGHSRRTHSGAVRAWLLELEAAGLVRKLDDQKPVCWVKV